MPSNNELRNQIKELDVGLDTAGMNNAELAELLKDLRAKQTDAETETIADVPRVENKPAPYAVAPGKAITVKRGIRSDGEDIAASDLEGGEPAFKRLLKSGYIVERR